MTTPLCVVPAGDWTGEGALWHAEERALYWVDINRFLIHRFDTDTGNVRHWFFNEPPTALALTDRTDTLLVALASRIILWQPRNDARADFASPERNWPRARLNDGRPDPAGNFWVGSMFNNVAADGTDIASNGAERRPAVLRPGRRLQYGREDRHRHHQHVCVESRTTRASTAPTRAPTPCSSGTTT